MIIIDTHIWVWWVSQPDKLSPEAEFALNSAERIGLSAISIWEIITKCRKGKLELDRPCDTWVEQAFASSGRLFEVAVTRDIASRAGSYSDDSFHGDPADRMIAATAEHHSAPLVTKDRLLRDNPKIRTIW